MAQAINFPARAERAPVRQLAINRTGNHKRDRIGPKGLLRSAAPRFKLFGMHRQPTAASRFDVFYRRYIAACRELNAIPLPKPELLTLIGALVERAAATLN